MIEIDGSQGEGGGQVLRSALTLSLLTGKPFSLKKIRAHRKPKPGLQAQHLMSVRAAAKIGNAIVSGDALGSSTIVFEPNKVVPGEYLFAIGTAGATSLVAQTISLPLAMAGGTSRVEIIGGTHAIKAPSFHFLRTTWCGFLAKMGIAMETVMHRPGFYPRGGGLIELKISPTGRIRSLQLGNKAEFHRATVLSAAASLPDHVIERQSKTAVRHLQNAGFATELIEEKWEGGPGSIVAITADGSIPSLFCGLGEKGKPAERVALDAVEELVAHTRTGCPVDPHSADQILLPLCFAEGSSEYLTSSITQHLLTNAEVIRQFLSRKIEIEGEEGERGVVRIAKNEL